MTANEINALNARETQRSNLAREVETNRSNLVKEAETARSNRANEALSDADSKRRMWSNIIGSVVSGGSKVAGSIIKR